MKKLDSPADNLQRLNWEERISSLLSFSVRNELHIWFFFLNFKLFWQPIGFSAFIFLASPWGKFWKLKLKCIFMPCLIICFSLSFQRTIATQAKWSKLASTGKSSLSTQLLTGRPYARGRCSVRGLFSMIDRLPTSRTWIRTSSLYLSLLFWL